MALPWAIHIEDLKLDVEEDEKCVIYLDKDLSQELTLILFYHVATMWLCTKFLAVHCSAPFVHEHKMAEHDLSKTIIPYLDRHLSFPLLTHLVDSSIFPAEEVQVAQYELAKGTNMFDYAVNLFEQINPDEEVPAGKKCPWICFEP